MLPENKPSKAEIHSRLRELEGDFEREMLARGFELSQLDNIALPARLAKLYAECEELRRIIAEGEKEGEQAN